MTTIKRKVEMNLPQLIEWAWDNIDEVQSEIFISNVSDFFGNYSTVCFSVDGYGFKTDSVSHKDTFTVEGEEEITEDMEFHHTVERFISRYVNKYRYATHNNKSIKDILNNRPPHVETTHIYAEVDKELVLIWRDGRLVE